MVTQQYKYNFKTISYSIQINLRNNWSSTLGESCSEYVLRFPLLISPLENV